MGDASDKVPLNVNEWQLATRLIFGAGSESVLLNATLIKHMESCKREKSHE